MYNILFLFVIILLSNFLERLRITLGIRRTDIYTLSVPFVAVLMNITSVNTTSTQVTDVVEMFRNFSVLIDIHGPLSLLPLP